MDASAYVVGQRGGATTTLIDLARLVGFATVERYAGLARAEQQADRTPLLFFLCAAVEDVRTLRPVADAIRFSTSFHLRFAPLIYLAADLSLDAAKACIGMGFDDVIAIPFTGGRLDERFGRQVGKPQIYFETSTYFGPDRRNRLGQNRPGGSEGGVPYRRIEIVRRPQTGVEVLQDDVHL